jgi:hypothetical protein
MPDSAVTTYQQDGDAANSKQYLNLTRQEWLTPLMFLLSMSMMGLTFPLGYLLVPYFLIRAYHQDRYDFIIMLTLFLGGYALIGEHNLHFKTADLSLIVSVIAIIVYRKSILLRKILIAVAIYVFLIFVLASYSDESMSVQLRTMRNYWGFIYFMVPLIVFANQKFDIKIFFRKLFPYTLILCIFYIIDSYILCGNILVPNSYIWGGRISTFFAPIFKPFSFSFVRKYPPGLYILALAIFPTIKYYKLTKAQWIIVLLALGATQTFTLITGVVVAYIVLQGKAKQLFKYALIAVAGLCLLYFVDGFLPVNSNSESTLRIKSSVDQFTSLSEAVDVEDVAEFGSGRIGQVLPKFDLMYSLHKEWTGLGFLHKDYTTSSKYQLENEFYSDVQQRDEVATGIEIIPLQIVISIGYLGLILHILFFWYTYYAIRKSEYSGYYLSAILIISWFGLGGFSGLIQYQGEALAALAYGVVLLDIKSKESDTSHEDNSLAF